MELLKSTLVHVGNKYVIAKIGQLWTRTGRNIYYPIYSICLHNGEVFFFLSNLELKESFAVDMKTFENDYSFNGHYVDRYVHTIEYNIKEHQEKLNENDLKIKQLGEKIKEAECYKEYSNYVRHQIELNKMPLMFSLWEVGK